MSKETVITQEEYESFLGYCDKAVRNRRKTLTELVAEFNTRFREELTAKALGGRLARYRKRASKRSASKYKQNSKNVSPLTCDTKEYMTTFSDKSIEAQKIIEYSEIVFGDEDKLLEYLGYNPRHWMFTFIQRSVWSQSTKKADPTTGKHTRDLYAVKFRVKPRTDFDPVDYAEGIREACRELIEPMEVTYTPDDKPGLKNDKLMEIAPVELHLGKLAHNGETGQDYDIHIATAKFYAIFDTIIEKQRIEKCGRCLLVIGSDFFNSESDNMTTSKTPQQNDTRYKKMMIEGFKMYVSALKRLRETFNSVDVILCSGNHARAMEFFLFHSLAQYFRNDDIINFSDDYKDTQAYVFGKCAIFYNHGDANLKRTISSIPSEFYSIWGKTIFRELHLGHLHKEVTVDDDCGMVTRRIGSPSAVDAWHYTNRFVGATQKHQVFVWNAQKGLECIHYINTENIK